MAIASSIIIIVVGALVGALGGFVAKPGGNKLTGQEAVQALKGGAIAGAIFGGVAGILLSIFTVINLGFNGLLSTLVMALTGALVGAVCFMLFNVGRLFLISALGEKGAGILMGVGVGVIAGILVNLLILPAGGSVAIEYWKFGLEPVTKTVGQGLTELAKFKYCLYADPKCPFMVDWSDANVQSAQEALSVGVSFSEYQIKNDKTDILATLSVKNPEKYELHLTPKCYLGKALEKARPITIRNAATYFQGVEFIFPMSSETLSSSLRCSSDVPECQNKNVCLDQKVFLVLTRPVRLQGTWPIYIGHAYSFAGPQKVQTSLKFNAPWQITLYSSDDMPYDEKKTYNFQLAIKQRDEETKLNNIELIRITVPQNINIQCENFAAVSDTELELRNSGTTIDENWLKQNAQYDPNDNKYTMPCAMYVKKANLNAELSPIEIESDYTVTSTFSHVITKQPGE
jgi:hypothetical protein